MKRRDLFSKLAAVAAAVSLAPAVKVVEASEPTSEVLPTLSSGNEYRLTLRNTGPGDGLYVWPTPIPSAWGPKYTTQQLDDVKAALGSAPSFEAQQADCAARGCSIERQICTDSEGAWVNYYHRPLPDSWQDNPGDPSHLARVDSWRRSLHGEDG